MEVFITDEEWEREKHLHTPHQIVYVLDGKVLDLLAYKEVVAEGQDLSQAPTSC